jgi:hypothetical protein
MQSRARDLRCSAASRRDFLAHLSHPLLEAPPEDGRGGGDLRADPDPSAERAEAHHAAEEPRERRRERPRNAIPRTRSAVTGAAQDRARHHRSSVAHQERRHPQEADGRRGASAASGERDAIRVPNTTNTTVQSAVGDGAEHPDARDLAHEAHSPAPTA